MTKTKVYVYGTLRPGTEKTVEIPGFMYDLGWYPGVILGGPGCNGRVVAEIIEADDDRLARLDRYEGYRESDPEGSLYLRQPYEDGFIYVFNQDVEGYPVVDSGDWLAYTKSRRGCSAVMVEEVEEGAA